MSKMKKLFTAIVIVCPFIFCWASRVIILDTFPSDPSTHFEYLLFAGVMAFFISPIAVLVFLKTAKFKPLKESFLITIGIEIIIVIALIFYFESIPRV